MSVYMNNGYYPIKLLKSGFVANVKWRKEPGFGIASQISVVKLKDTITYNSRLLHGKLWITWRLERSSMLSQSRDIFIILRQV